MDVQACSEWIASYPTSERIRVLALIYSSLTIRTRQLFLPESAGREKRVLEILHGVNEIHHTIANYMVDYMRDEDRAFSVHTLCQQLLEIETQYRLEKILTPSIESIRRKS